MFKKTLITAALVFSFALVPIAFADTASDLQAQINAILAQIKVLQSAISGQSGNTSTAVTTNSSSTGGSCYTFSTSLVSGSRDTRGVLALTTDLTKEGLLSGSTATYDDTVAAAVVQFQGKYGITQTGTVGPITRAKLNLLYGCGNTNNPPVVVNPPTQVCGPGASFSSVTGLPCGIAPTTSTQPATTAYATLVLPTTNLAVGNNVLQRYSMTAPINQSVIVSSVFSL